MAWLVVCLAILLLYLFVVAKRRVVRNESLLFILSIGLLYLLIGSPLYALSHLTMSFHMVYMSLLFFVIPPLILFGLPEELIRIGTSVKALNVPPIFALFSFASLFFLYHLPFVFSVLQQHSFIHHIYVAIMFYLSFFIWLPFVVLKESQPFARLSSAVITPACLLFIFVALFGKGENPLLAQLFYSLCLPDYEAAKLLPFPYNPQFDLFFAGVVMLTIHKVALLFVQHLQSTKDEWTTVPWKKW